MPTVCPDNRTHLNSVTVTSLANRWKPCHVGDAITALGPTTSGSVSRRTLMTLCLSQSGKWLMPTPTLSIAGCTGTPRLNYKDPVIGKLLQWTRDAGEPSQHELFLSGEAVKHFWINHQQLVIKSGLLYYRWEQPAEPVLQLMLPSCLVQDAIRGHHTSKLGGHFNHEKTLTRLRQRYMWYRMASDYKNYALACDSCGRSKKPNRKPKANLCRYHAGSPLERVHIDILGPFVRSDRGNQYILMIVDQFTKWVECFPLPRQNADLVARAMVDGFISREGCPLQIHTDQADSSRGNCLPLSVSYWRSQKRGLPPITPPRMDR